MYYIMYYNYTIPTTSMECLSPPPGNDKNYNNRIIGCILNHKWHLKCSVINKEQVKLFILDKMCVSSLGRFC